MTHPRGKFYHKQDYTAVKNLLRLTTDRLGDFSMTITF